MYDYGEACPISKATTVLCERWTLQILREMMLGATRFSELQKMLPRISPSLLNARLRSLTESELIIRKRIPEQRGFEYHLTPAGKALQPVLEEIGRWGMRWIFDGMDEPEFDLTVMLAHIAALFKVEELPNCETVIQFTLEDLDGAPERFMFFKNGKREVCDENRGFEVDVYLRCTTRTLAGVWWGDLELKNVLAAGDLKVVAPPIYRKSIHKWFPISDYSADNPRSSRERLRADAEKLLSC